MIDLVNTRVATGQLYKPGGLFNQPYFLMSYVEPWIKQAYEELKAVRKTDTVGQEHGLDAAIQAALRGAFE